MRESDSINTNSDTVTDTLCNLQHENEKTFEVVEEKNCVV